MSPTVATGTGDLGSSERDRSLVARSSAVDRYLAMLRLAMVETGWTIDSLAAHLDVDKAHVSRLLCGEKPWRLEHLVALPLDMERCFERKRAEYFGLIVVERVDTDTAEQHLAIGLLNILRRPTPAKVDAPHARMAKASL